MTNMTQTHINTMLDAVVIGDCPRGIAADALDEVGREREAFLMRHNLLVSETAVQRGRGTDRYKSVVYMTPLERAHGQAGGQVAFRSEYRSGGNSGTYWRLAVDHGRYGFVPRVPPVEITEELERLF